MDFIKLMFEALTIGLMTLVLAYIITKLMKKEFSHGTIFFLTGFFIHVIFEYLGFNKWYCGLRCAESCKVN